MNAFFWLVAFIVGLVAATYLVSSVVASLRARRFELSALGVVLVSVLAFAAFGPWKNPYATSLVAICGLAFARLALRRVTRNAQHASTTTRLSATHLALLFGSFLFLVPFAWLISTSLKTDEEQAVFPPVWIPTQQQTTPDVKGADGFPGGLSAWKPSGASEPMEVVEVENLPTGAVRVQALSPAVVKGQTFTAERADLTKHRHVAPRWENYSDALAFLPAETHYGLVFLGNTLFLTLMSTIGTLLSSSLVAYSFARLQWPGKNILFGVLLATMMVPGAVTMMPQFLIYRSLGWYDTLRPLWVPAFFGSAFNIFLLRQFFMSIPSELEDAAKIDGCGPFGVYWRVMLPLVKPALAAISIMTVLGAWNNFQGPLIYLSSPEKMPLAYALQLYSSAHGGEPGLLMAASTLVVLPIIALFFFTQRYFIEGVSLTGLGGR